SDLRSITLVPASAPRTTSSQTFCIFMVAFQAGSILRRIRRSANQTAEASTPAAARVMAIIVGKEDPLEEDADLGGACVDETVPIALACCPRYSKATVTDCGPEAAWVGRKLNA